MKDKISYFRLTYSLFSKDFQEHVSLFDTAKPIYTANIVADTLDKAVAELKHQFHMMHVQVLGASDKLEMSREEYERE